MPPNMTTREVDVHPVYRIHEVRGVREEGDAVLIDLSFSSEYGVERYDWWDDEPFLEVLDHDSASVRMDRLTDGAPFLMDHNHRNQVGVIAAARIDNVKRQGVATIRLSRNAANHPQYGDLVADFRDGIRRKVSVGYRVYRARREEEKSEGPNTYRIVDWEPFEISSVSVPADPTVGLDRAATENLRGMHKPNTLIIEERTMPEETPTPENTERSETLSLEQINQSVSEAVRAANGDNKFDADEVANKIAAGLRKAQVIDNDETRAGDEKKVREKERARLDKIDEAVRHVCKVPGVPADKVAELARKYKDDGKDPSDFFADAMDKYAGEGTREAREGDSDVGLSAQEIRNYSWFRAFNAVRAAQTGTRTKGADFELECHEAAAEKRAEAKRAHQGLLIPPEVLRAKIFDAELCMPSRRLARQTLQRDLLVGTVSSGTGAGAMTETVVDLVSFIDLLRDALVLRSLGIRVIDGLEGDLALPRQTGGATAYWVGENGAITESTPTFDQVILQPHTVGALVEISRRSLIQPQGNIAEQLVVSDMAMQIARAIDSAGIVGNPDDSTTPNVPRGILHVSGIGSVTGGYTYDMLVDLETEVAIDNAAMGSLNYLMNAYSKGQFKKAKLDTGSGERVWMPNSNELNGYSVGVTNAVPNDIGGSGTETAVIFGNFADQILGLWSGLDMIVDPYTNSAKGALRLVALQDCDYQYRHAQSFAANTELDGPNEA